MRRNRPIPTDYLAAALISAVGLLYFVGSYEYDMGTSRHMGPGFLPRAYAICAVVLGIFILIGSMRQKSIDRSALDYRFFRSFIGIIASIIAFALVIPKFGLIPAAMVSVILAGLGSEYFKVSTTLWMAVVTSLATWLVFSVLLGLPIPGLKGL
jgi:hypothetical protein